MQWPAIHKLSENLSFGKDAKLQNKISSSGSSPLLKSGRIRKQGQKWIDIPSQTTKTWQHKVIQTLHRYVSCRERFNSIWAISGSKGIKDEVLHWTDKMKGKKKRGDGLYTTIAALHCTAQTETLWHVTRFRFVVARGWTSFAVHLFSQKSIVSLYTCIHIYLSYTYTIGGRNAGGMTQSLP
jgi:hypothetical protein